MGKKERLIEIQDSLFDLEHLLVDISETKQKRDKQFKMIVKALGDLIKKDFWKEYELWRDGVLSERGIIEQEVAMVWLRNMFQQVADKLK